MHGAPINARAILRIVVDRFHATGEPVNIGPLFATSSVSDASVREAVQYWSDQGVLEPAGNDQTYLPTARAYDVLNRGSS